MDKFYFDVREDGILATDDDGVEIKPSTTLRREALSYFGEIAREVISSDHGCSSVSLEVRDKDGLVMVASLSISVDMKRDR